MSAGPDSSTERITVYVPLLNEGTDVIRPTEGIVIGPNEVRLLEPPGYDPETETWAFLPGAEVKWKEIERNGQLIRVVTDPVE